MKPHCLISIAFVLSVVVLAPRETEAFCTGDSYGSAAASITILGTNLAGISATATLSHTPNAHPTCFGSIRAKVMLNGYACSDGFKSTGHLPDGSGTTVTASTVCSIPCGVFQYANGEFDWNGVENERFEQSNGARSICDCEPPPGGCSIEGCVWSYYECDCVDCCPIVFDTSGKGYKLTSADRGVWFDINADGQQDAISWTDPTRDVAFLAFDRNGNNVVDDGEELFGNVTPLPPGSDRQRANHGFDALASLEDESYGPSVKDGTIDASDAAYHKLLLWKDANHDGISQANEIRKASAAGLIAIESRYRESRRTDEFGNEFRLRGISWWDRGALLNARLFYDVWFVPKH
ncbi:MAG TPA: hypothetical protein VIL28_11975 [Steroidobacteraceae bacterium]|jgi:hypothetical protein